jgi:hypothetical protein
LRLWSFAEYFEIFDRDYRIRPSWQRITCINILCLWTYKQLHRIPVTRALGLCCPQSVPIHSGGVVMWRGYLRPDWLGADPSQRLVQRDVLGFERLPQVGIPQGALKTGACLV